MIYGNFYVNGFVFDVGVEVDSMYGGCLLMFINLFWVCGVSNNRFLI